MATNVDEIYRQHIKSLDTHDRLRLLALVAQDLAPENNVAPEAAARRSIMELHGLGAEIWQGVNAQEYVDELRAEWDHRP